ncbi:MAG: hypothetical protein EA385_02140 [Salinarimonadaceae bacterium]|nr:MAG: hypothetical protein EA385_02140 [Salinarimonadaceae bacterium]
MFRTNLFAMSALGLCLAIAPVMVGAPSAQPRDEKDAVFVPLVDACVSAPTVETCQQVRAVVTKCASDLDHVLCSVLFEDSEDVFADPALLKSSQTTLSEAAEAIAAMEFSGTPHSDIDDATRADAERTLLRGDENLQSHSAPPLMESAEPSPAAKAGETIRPNPTGADAPIHRRN